jgi:co-chaperonin GroES (HSP10)
VSLTPLRGRVVIREHKAARFDAFPSLVIPDQAMADERARTSHIGTVLGMGPPVQTSSGADIAHGFKVGDTVTFHFEATEEGRKAPWEDGLEALWMAQREVDAVIEP